MIKVEVYRIYLIVEKEHVRLTKAIAKQFPIASTGDRVDLAIQGLEASQPICKVLAPVIFGSDHSQRQWLLLVRSDVGLRWEYPATFDEQFEAGIRRRGGWVDDLSAIPTVVL